ncbi:hypothetical protein ACFLV0_07085 [Chloroflexota bacterium]
MKRVVLIVTVVLVLAVSVIGCVTGTKTEPTPTVADDNPYLSTTEVIAIVKEHVLTSTATLISEKRAVGYIRRLDAFGKSDESFFRAKYLGSGKWEVSLRVFGPQELFYYRWTVFERDLNVVFLDERYIPVTQENMEIIRELME